jgi:hypothetical protein
MEVVVLRYNINNAADRVLHTTIAKVGRTLVTTASKHVFDVGGNYPVGKESTNEYGTHLRTVRQYEEKRYTGKVREALYELTSPRGVPLTVDMTAALGEVLGVDCPACVDPPLRQLLYLASRMAYLLHNEGIGREVLQQYAELVQTFIDKGVYAKTLKDPELRIPSAGEL